MAQPVQPVASRRSYAWGGAFPWNLLFLLVALIFFVVAALIFFGLFLKTSTARTDDGLGCVAVGLACLTIASARG